MSKSKLNLILAASMALASVLQIARAAAPAPTPLLTKRGENELLAILKSDAAFKEKADACRELGVIGGKAAVPVLAGMLADEQLNHIARCALEPNPDPSVDEVFRACLNQLKGRPLVGVIHSIGVRRDAKSASALAKLLADGDPDVAQAAARSLGTIGTSDAANAIQSVLASVSSANRLALSEGLFRCAESLAGNGQRTEAIVIYDQLRGLKEPHQVRAGGWRGAILARGMDGSPLLAEALRSDDWIVIAAAARAAMQLPGSDVTPIIAAELAKGSADKRLLLIRVLGRRADAGALPALFATAKSGETAIRVAAIRAIAEIGQPKAADGLVLMLNDADKDIAQAAQESLASLPGPETDSLVLAMLNSTDASRRITGLDLITRRRMTSSIAAVVEAASDADIKVRSVAIRRLGELAGPSEQPAVLAMLLKAKPGAELDAAEQSLITLSVRMEDPEAAASKLVTAMSQADAEKKGALLRVLSAIGGKTALACVRSAVKAADPEVRNAAIRALGDWTTADAGPDLLVLAKETGNARDRLLCLRSYLVLAGNTEFPADQRLSMCREVNPLIQSAEEKRLFLAALASIQTQPALALVTPYLDDETVRNEAGTAVVAIAARLLRNRDISRIAPRLVEPLQKVTQNASNPDLAQRAAPLLKQAQAGARRD